MCKREDLFSESYISYPIGQFLTAHYASSLKAEYPHPRLAPFKTGRGDKPRVDFVVADEQNNIEIAIETKWLSSSTTLVRDVIRDVIRLELLIQNATTKSYLI